MTEKGWKGECQGAQVQLGQSWGVCEGMGGSEVGVAEALGASQGSLRGCAARQAFPQLCCCIPAMANWLQCGESTWQLILLQLEVWDSRTWL